jgi:hypothetical protein
VGRGAAKQRLTRQRSARSATVPPEIQPLLGTVDETQVGMEGWGGEGKRPVREWERSGRATAAPGGAPPPRPRDPAAAGDGRCSAVGRGRDGRGRDVRHREGRGGKGREGEETVEGLGEVGALRVRRVRGRQRLLVLRVEAASSRGGERL